MSLPTAVAVLAVGGTDAAPAERDLADVVAWFGTLSDGAWTPAVATLPTLRLDHALARYTSARGLAASGPNSRDLTTAAIAALDAPSRARLAAAGGRLMLLVPDGFRAHCWYPARGGIALGGGAWCRHFALVPASAPFGTVTHELGHLLAGWPEGDVSAGYRCLMALGGLAGGGHTPVPPAAPLLLAAGWRTAAAMTAGLTVTGLAARSRGVGTLEWRGHRIVAEIRPGRLLAWTGPAERPRLLADRPTTGCDDLPLLGLLAPNLRRLPETRGPGADRCHAAEPKIPV